MFPFIKEAFNYIQHKDNKEQHSIHALGLNTQDIDSKFRSLIILTIPNSDTLSIWFSLRSPYSAMLYYWPIKSMILLTTSILTTVIVIALD